LQAFAIWQIKAHIRHKGQTIGLRDGQNKGCLCG
jgi:hypothetical protein